MKRDAQKTVRASCPDAFLPVLAIEKTTACALAGGRYRREPFSTDHSPLNSRCNVSIAKESISSVSSRTSATPLKSPVLLTSVSNVKRAPSSNALQSKPRHGLFPLQSSSSQWQHMSRCWAAGSLRRYEQAFQENAFTLKPAQSLQKVFLDDIQRKVTSSITRQQASEICWLPCWTLLTPLSPSFYFSCMWTFSFPLGPGRKSVQGPQTSLATLVLPSFLRHHPLVTRGAKAPMHFQIKTPDLTSLIRFAGECPAHAATASCQLMHPEPGKDCRIVEVTSSM